MIDLHDDATGMQFWSATLAALMAMPFIQLWMGL
jgi:hypothetical protein